MTSIQEWLWNKFRIPDYLTRRSACILECSPGARVCRDERDRRIVCLDCGMYMHEHELMRNRFAGPPPREIMRRIGRGMWLELSRRSCDPILNAELQLINEAETEEAELQV